MLGGRAEGGEALALEAALAGAGSVNSVLYDDYAPMLLADPAALGDALRVLPPGTSVIVAEVQRLPAADHQ